jgi:hypothetical protein
VAGGGVVLGRLQLRLDDLDVVPARRERLEFLLRGDGTCIEVTLGPLRFL